MDLKTTTTTIDWHLLFRGIGLEIKRIRHLNHMTAREFMDSIGYDSKSPVRSVWRWEVAGLIPSKQVIYSIYKYHKKEFEPYLSSVLLADFERKIFSCPHRERKNLHLGIEKLTQNMESRK
jgi:hypothetical protein